MENKNQEIAALLQCLHDAYGVIAEGFELGDKACSLSLHHKGIQGYSAVFKAGEIAGRAVEELATRLGVTLTDDSTGPDLPGTKPEKPSLRVVE